jgi:hypothetical protein
LVPPATQARIVTDLVDLITYVGVRANLYQNKDDLAQIRSMLSYTTSALKVIDPASASKLSWLTAIPPAATPAEILSHTSVVWSTVQSDADFKSLPKPADLTPMAPPPPAEPTKPGAPAQP